MAWARQPPVPPRAGGGATLLTVPGERWEGRDRGIHSSGSLNSSPEANGDDTGPRGTTRETGGAQGGGSGDAAPLPASTLPFRNDFSGQGSNWVASLGTEKIPEDVTRAGTSALRAGKGRQASRGRRQAAGGPSPERRGYGRKAQSNPGPTPHNPDVGEPGWDWSVPEPVVPPKLEWTPGRRTTRCHRAPMPGTQSPKLGLDPRTGIPNQQRLVAHMRLKQF